MRHADRFIVEGDNVGQKNIYLLGEQRAGRLRFVSPLLVEAARKAFVDPAGWADVRAAAEKLRTVILRGGPGHGKLAAAIRLLLPMDGPLYLLDDTVDLAKLPEWLEAASSASDAASADSAQQRRGAGFILTQPLGFALLRGSVLQGLEEALMRADARLIITVATDSGAPAPDLRGRDMALCPNQQ